MATTPPLLSFLLSFRDVGSLCEGGNVICGGVKPIFVGGEGENEEGGVDEGVGEGDGDGDGVGEGDGAGEGEMHWVRGGPHRPGFPRKDEEGNFFKDDGIVPLS